MKLRTILLAGAVCVPLPGVAMAQEEEPSLGKYEYETSCAVCHGVSGQGDGPYAQFLRQSIPDLTGISKKNEGVFPFDRIYRVIDGRMAVEGHGTEEMPIWGDRYRAEAFKERGEFFGHFYAEDLVQARILALVSYIHELQQ